MRNLSNLKPSSQDPIPAAILRELPLRGIYIFAGNTVRITGWTEDWECLHQAILTDGTFVQDPFIASEMEEIEDLWLYPKLPAMVFRETAAQVASGEKDVTRRRTAPTWCRPGALFMGWDRAFRGGKGKARGLGVFEVVSVSQQWRWICPVCEPPPLTGPVVTKTCMWHGRVRMSDTLTAAELNREGFPDLEPDDFWAMLKKLGGVDDSGMTTRIEFKRL